MRRKEKKIPSKKLKLNKFACNNSDADQIDSVSLQILFYPVSLSLSLSLSLCIMQLSLPLFVSEGFFFSLSLFIYLYLPVSIALSLPSLSLKSPYIVDLLFVFFSFRLIFKLAIAATLLSAFLLLFTSFSS